jgi:hypothetical protein
VHLTPGMNWHVTTGRLAHSLDRRYLCEYTYYRSMHVLGVPAIFVHVPPVDSPYDMAELLTAMKHVIARAVEEVCGNMVVPNLLIGHGHLDQWVVKFTDLVSA